MQTYRHSQELRACPVHVLDVHELSWIALNCKADDEGLPNSINEFLTRAH